MMQKQSLVELITQKSTKRTLLFMLLWFSILILSFSIRHILLPFVIAGLLAFVLNPLVTWMNKANIFYIKIPRVAALFLVYIFIIFLVGVMGNFFAPQIYHEMTKLARDIVDTIQGIDDEKIAYFTNQLSSFFKEYRLPIEVLGPGASPIGLENERQTLFTLDLQHITKQLLNDAVLFIQHQSAHIASEVKHIIEFSFEAVFEVFLVLVITAFILADTQKIQGFTLQLIPKHRQPEFEHFLRAVDKGLSGVVRGQLFICLINGILTLTGLLLLHVKFAFLLATIAGILSIIPIFGSILSTIPIVLVGISSSFTTGIFALLWIIGIHALEANLLNPKILGNSAKIHPVLITLSLVVGKHFYGIFGLLLAVPIASILITIFKTFLQKAHKLDEAVAKH